MNNTNTTVSNALALGLCVLVTLPPVSKIQDPAAKPYWRIEIRDQGGLRYSKVYRVTDLDRAHALAERIAAQRKLPIVTQEPPAPRQPAAEVREAPLAPVDSYDYDNNIPVR